MDFAAPLDVAVEEFSEWDVERPLEGRAAATYRHERRGRPLGLATERKPSRQQRPGVICAYLAAQAHHTILDSVSDPVMVRSYRAMQSGAGLVKKFSTSMSYANILFIYI